MVAMKRGAVCPTALVVTWCLPSDELGRLLARGESELEERFIPEC